MGDRIIAGASAALTAKPADPAELAGLVEAIVAATGADKRSVIKRLAGLEVRGAAGRAIDRAIAERCSPSVRAEAGPLLARAVR